MRAVAAVNVTCGDAGPNELVLSHWEQPAVIGPSVDAGQVAGKRTVQPDDLAVDDRRADTIRDGPSLHSQVGICQLHHPVRLTRDNEGVFGNAYVEGLSTAA